MVDLGQSDEKRRRLDELRRRLEAATRAGRHAYILMERGSPDGAVRTALGEVEVELQAVSRALDDAKGDPQAEVQQAVEEAYETVLERIGAKPRGATRDLFTAVFRLGAEGKTTVQEVSRQLGLNPNTLSKRLRRAGLPTAQDTLALGNSFTALHLYVSGSARNFDEAAQACGRGSGFNLSTRIHALCGLRPTQILEDQISPLEVVVRMADGCLARATGASA